MAAKQNITMANEGQTTEDIPLTSLEESLLSLEKLDRTSPELWPEQITTDFYLNFVEMCDENVKVCQSDDESRCSADSFSVPGVSKFTPLPSATTEVPSWKRGPSQEDINLMQKLGSLTTSGLIMEVKKLHDLAYQLGLEEAKEMTRGKYLNIFSRKQR